MITGSNQIHKWVLRIYGVRNTTFNFVPKDEQYQETLVFFMDHDTIFFPSKRSRYFRQFSISHRKITSEGIYSDNKRE